MTGRDLIVLNRLLSVDYRQTGVSDLTGPLTVDQRGGGRRGGVSQTERQMKRTIHVATTTTSTTSQKY